MALSSINLFNSNFHNNYKWVLRLKRTPFVFAIGSNNWCYNPLSSHMYEMKGGSFYGEKMAAAYEEMDHR
jgi:hypothetical protein